MSLTQDWVKDTGGDPAWWSPEDYSPKSIQISHSLFLFVTKSVLFFGCFLIVPDTDCVNILLIWFPGPVVWSLPLNLTRLLHFGLIHYSKEKKKQDCDLQYVLHVRKNESKQEEEETREMESDPNSLLNPCKAHMPHGSYGLYFLLYNISNTFLWWWSMTFPKANTKGGWIAFPKAVHSQLKQIQGKLSSVWKSFEKSLNLWQR